MADSKVTIKIDADAEGAKRAFAEVQSSADAAMESGARSAQKLSRSLDGVADSAKVSAQQIKTVAAGMASMAAGVAAAALKNQGMDATASYMGAASRGGVQGATMMAPLGPLAMIAGALGGAGLGALQNYFERDTQGKEQGGAEVKAADALAKAREEMERVAARTDTFAKYLEKLGDAELDAASREQWRADEIAERQRQIEEATERMASAEKELAANGREIAAQGAPATKEQTEAAERLREAWARASKDLATARAEMKSLEGVKIERAKPESSNDRVQGEFTSLEKLGIGFNAHADSLAQEGNKIANEQLAVLKQIANVAGNGVVFG